MDKSEGTQTPERSGRKEVVLGDYESMHLPVDKLIMLSQVRGGANPESHKLKQSIDSIGMINPIDVVRLSRDELIIYIDFVNSVWGSDLSIEDYDKREIDGIFYLVVAGHSRTRAVIELAKEKDIDYILNCKIHPVTSPEDIINLQLEENIHSKPPVERQAMAIVEAYIWGMQSGSWSSQKEFIDAQGGSIKSADLKKAIGFSRLPQQLRQFVLNRHIPYAAALEIGGITQILVNHEMMRIGYDPELPDEDLEKKLKVALQLQLGHMITYIASRKLNSTASVRYIQGRAKTMTEYMEGFDGDNTDGPIEEAEAMWSAEMLNFELVTPQQQADEYVEGLRREVQAAFDGLGYLPVIQIDNLLGTVGTLTAIDTEKARRELRRSAERARELLGESALAAVNA